MLFVSISPAPTFAQVMNYQRTCLKPFVCWNVAEHDYHDGDCFYASRHNARLSLGSGATLDKSLNNYIVEFFATEMCESCDDEASYTGGWIYTTGNSQLDLQLFGSDNLSVLKQITYDDRGKYPQYHFIGLFDQTQIPAPNPPYSEPTNEIWGEELSPANYPLLANNSYIKDDGKLVPLEWSDYTRNNYLRKWEVWTPVVTVAPSPGPTVAGNASTQQQQALSFEEAGMGTGLVSTCVSIFWDPYGRIFDSNSLEPVKSARVTLQKRSPTGEGFVDVNPNEIPFLSNPYIVKEDGIFNFAVPDGDYKLKVNFPDYSFPGDPLKLNSNYSKAYFDIYKGDIITQKGKIEHRDVPIDPQKIAASSPVKMMEYSYDLDKKSGSIIIDGRASHPLTKVKAYSIKNGARFKLMKTIQADKWGRFKLEINQTNFESLEIFGEVELEKVNLAKNLNEEGSNAIFKLEYIPNYLEGYAYDGSGNIIPNATVGIYLQYSNKPYYETKADEKGYFKITSSDLPSLPYKIRYTTPFGSTIKITTSKFAVQNSLFIESKKISLGSYITKAGVIVTPAVRLGTGFAENKIGVSDQHQQTTSSEETTSNQKNLSIVILVVLFLIGAVGTIIGVYLYKKNQSPSIPPFN